MLSLWSNNNSIKRTNSLTFSSSIPQKDEHDEDEPRQQQRQQKNCFGTVSNTHSSQKSSSLPTVTKTSIMFCIIFLICNSFLDFRSIQSRILTYHNYVFIDNNKTILNYYMKDEYPISIATDDNYNDKKNTNQNDYNENIEQNRKISCIIHKPLHFNLSDDSPRVGINVSTGILKHSTKTSLSFSSAGTVNTTIQGQQQQQRQQQQNEDEDYDNHSCGTLQRQWYKINEPKTKYGKLIQRNQRNTTKPIMIYYLNNLYGMGSHFLLYSQGLCNAIISKGHRLQIILEDQYESWLWSDQSYCKNDSLNHTPSSLQSHISPFKCYFPQTELQEIDATTTTNNNNNTITTNETNKFTFPKARAAIRPWEGCNIVGESNHSRKEWRIGTIEYLFQELNPIIIQEAQRQIGIIFSSGVDDTNSSSSSNTQGRNLITVPDDLITVHIRWGDKFWEMKLAKIEEYIEAVKQMLLIQYYHKQQEKQYQYQNINYYKQQTTVKTTIKIDHNTTNNYADIDTFLYNRNNNNSTSYSSNDTNNTTIVSIIEQYMNDKELYDNITSTANIYLATEDPEAVSYFLKYKPKGWNVYYDITIHELQSLRPKRGNQASWTARNTKGRAGLIALGSLLVALESNYFILTTNSNWSAIINYLRLSIINYQCMNCTTMIDLRPKFF